jgi:folate-dependent phosphoribosylglycinamide formyltransferase PurN
MLRHKIMVSDPEDKTPYQLLYSPFKDHPMSVIVFASGGGNNLKTVIYLAKKQPTLLSVDLVVTDRLKIKAIEIAKYYGIPVIAREFEKECGIWSDCKDDAKKALDYHKRALGFHNSVLVEIQKLEKERNRQFDLVVLSYHRWIHGRLLEYFRNRIINQHAGDLTVMVSEKQNVRKYVGINPVLLALRNGEKRTRTSTFLVNEGHDSGEILCQGSWVTYRGVIPVTKESAWDHECIQKKQSDRQSLIFALTEIALGNFGIAKDVDNVSGSRAVFYKGKPLSYGGIDLEQNYA